MSNKQYIIINDTLNILNARREIVYQFQNGEKVEILDVAKYYWITKHGAVWFSQAKHEAQVKKEAELKLAAENARFIAFQRQQEALFLAFLAYAMTGKI